MRKEEQLEQNWRSIRNAKMDLPEEFRQQGGGRDLYHLYMGILLGLGWAIEDAETEPKMRAVLSSARLLGAAINGDPEEN